MIVNQSIGGMDFTAIIGPHDGTDVPKGVVRVTGPLLPQPAEYRRSHRAADTEGREAIRYTVDNIVLPLLAAKGAA